MQRSRLQTAATTTTTTTTTTTMMKNQGLVVISAAVVVVRGGSGVSDDGFSSPRKIGKDFLSVGEKLATLSVTLRLLW